MSRASDYVFRFDGAIPARHFGDDLQLSGWLVHSGGAAVHGIRVVVQRRLVRERIWKARRKRNRPDAAAAFPDLPAARTSGFYFEFPLALGANRLRFEVLDAERVWQTFHTATVRAFPLTSVGRAGFPRVRKWALGSLRRAYPEANILRQRPPRATPAGTSAISRVELFATTQSNLFIREIGELLTAGFTEAGCAAQLHLDEPPLPNPPDDTLQIIVTPHEFFNLYLSAKFSQAEARARAVGAVLLCTEQPNTPWFQSNLQWAPYARAFADINPLGVLGYCARDARCHHLALGYHPLLRAGEIKPTPARATEITFLGSLTPRREEFFGANAAFFSARRAHLRFVPLDFAKTETTRSYLSAQRRNDLLADTRILLNVHYSAQRYFEWHRMLVGLANGCCIITENCEGYGALVPGEHFVMVEPENLIAACEYYLARPDECARIAEQGFEFIEKQLRQGQLCAAFLRDLTSPGCEVPPDAAPRLWPRDLRREFAQQNRRALRHAIAADVRDLWHPPAPLRAEPPLPSEEELAAKRVGAIENRAAYRARFVEQEKRRAAGTSVWELHDNEAYRRAELPAVSVVITLFNYAKFIRECVTSVEHAASHFGKPIEILIVDDASTDDSLAAARSYQELAAVPFRIVAKQFNTGLADARNIGLGLARAEFVLMMDADNLILPPALADWYASISTDERAAAYGLLARFEDSPEKPFGLLSPYDWDPQILVQQPYIDAMALFRRDVLLELGGYDNDLNQIGWFGWEDYDLWLRIAARDLKVGFVPNILGLYRQHAISMLSVTNLFEQDLVAHFYERFGQLCARFEPHETVFGVARSKIEKGESSVFIASGCPIATTTLYRCEHLREQLEKLGHEAQVAEWFSEAAIDPEAALNYDLIVLYRLPMSEALKRLIDRAHELGKRVLFDTDDLVFEPDLIEWQRGVQLLSKSDQQLHSRGVERYLETLRACDAVITATPLLAELAAARGKTAYVHRNALGNEMTRLARELYELRPEQPKSGKIVIGYGSGTATHDVDFAEAATALARVLVHYDQVELWLAGPLELPDVLGEFANRIQRFPLTDWPDWFRLMNQMDIALAPLERGNVFCRAKSEIKFVEAGALGIPVVASRIDPFQFAIEDGVTGFLAESEEEWLRALCLLVDEPERRREVGEAARQRVTESYSPEARAAELQSLLAKVESAKLKLNWLIPEPFPGAGGDTGIFRLIRDLAEFGHDCEVYVVAYNLMSDFSGEQVRSYVREHFGESPAHYQRWEGTVRDADATFATFWPTAENLLALPNGGSRYYLVQDFEPSFYPDDPKHYDRAERTYRAGMHCITLGPWLAKLLRERYGAKAEHFDFAVDTETYRPRPGPKSKAKRICFYARPATPRRAYEMGLQVFARIHEEFPEVEIVFFGADELTPAPQYPFRNRGKLPQEELAQLFSSSEIGVVFSLSNPSFVPLEMMACGCAVLEIASERWDGILTHSENAWLVEPTAEAVVGGLRNLLTDENLRAELVANGQALTREMSWRNSARQIERILLRDLA